MVINHLLNGMILQVVGKTSTFTYDRIGCFCEWVGVETLKGKKISFPETNSEFIPENRGPPGSLVDTYWKPGYFRGQLLVSGRVCGKVL